MFFQYNSLFDEHYSTIIFATNDGKVDDLSKAIQYPGIPVSDTKSKTDLDVKVN